MKYQVIRIILLTPRKIRKLFYIYYNRLIFNLCGIKYGKNLRIYNHFYINKYQNSSIHIKDNFIFSSGDSFNPLSRNIRGCFHVEENASITIGNNVGISSSCLWAANSIQIGNNVMIGGDCIILDNDCHSLDYELRRRGGKTDTSNSKSKPIVIEDDVLIGTRSIVLKGVTIGARSIIGSGSVVTKSIPSDCIAGGNPCKVIKYINNK